VKLHGGEVKAEVADNGVGMQICIDLPLTVLSDEEVNDDEDNSLFEPSTSLEISTLAKLIKQRIPMISTGVKYLRRSSDSSGVRDSAAIMPLSTLPSNDTIDKPLAFLVVDDSAMVRKMTSQLIKHYGHLASEAVDGEDAVRKVKASAVSGAPFEVILMDNQMPNLMGTEATRIIRHELGFEGLIFGVTGNVLEEDLAKFVTNGANEVIAKPLTQDKFFDKILCHQALEHRIHPVRRASDGRRSSEGKHSGYTDGFIIESHSGYSSESEVAWQQENEEKREFKSLHFLIVDDSSMVRKLSSQLVRSFSHTLAEAIDGLDAIAAVKRSIEENRPYDIILMDNQMPKMMGVEATRIIREDLNYSGLIFGVTGNALDEDIKMFLRNGADDVLLKPLTKDKFNENILRFERIDRRRSSDMKRLTDSLVAKRIASSGRLAETPT
jgi:CheY-like chemotaxis protein